MTVLKSVREWLQWHLIRAHLLAPLWLRIPEKRRWDIVYWLNKSKRQCWCRLVDAALAYPEDDACDVHVPPLLGDRVPYCARTCGWFDHSGEHECGCYCGKFQFVAKEGGADRYREVAS